MAWGSIAIDREYRGLRMARALWAALSVALLFVSWVSLQGALLTCLPTLGNYLIASFVIGAVAGVSAFVGQLRQRERPPASRS